MRASPRLLARCLTLALLATACKDSNGPDKPGPPVDIRVSAGDNQKGAAGAALVAPIAAKVTDAKGRGIGGVEVTFTPDGGTVAPVQVQTNGSGIAFTTWTMPTVAGTYSVRASFIDAATGALIDTVSFHAKVIGGAPAAMYPSYDYPSRAATGSTQHITVQLFDRFGIPSPGYPVSFSTAAGGGSVSPATVQTDSLGRATVNWTLGTAGTNTLHIAYGNLASEVSISAVTPGTPANIVPQSYSGTVGVGTTIPLAVVVLDGLDQPVAGVGVNWSVVTGGGTLSATSSSTDAQGRASVQYTAGSNAGTNTVRATAGSLMTTLSFEARNLAPQLAYAGARLFGVGRTSAGTFVTSAIDLGRVVIFDESSPTVQRTVTTGGTPVVVAINDAGTTAWVSNMSGWVDVISIASGTDNKVALSGAHSLTMSPAGDRVYVASSEGRVDALSTTTNLVVRSLPVPGGPWGIAFKSTATDSLMYVTSRDAGTVTEIDTKTFTVLRTLSVSGRPHGIAISQDQTKLYVADNSLGKVNVIDISSGLPTASVSIAGAFGIAISPDGSTLFVTTDNGKGVVIATAGMTISKVYDLNVDGRQVIASPDGTKAWAATEGGSIDIINR